MAFGATEGIEKVVNVARRNNKWARTGDARPLPRHGDQLLGMRVETGPSWSRHELFYVRTMSGVDAIKSNICPGCDNIIPAGISHIVAWPKDVGRGPQDRRHWHSYCWQRR